MADTVDVARELFHLVTGYEFRDGMYMDDVNAVEVLYHLETLSTVFRIGIEDARRLLRNKGDDSPTMAHMRRSLYLPEN